MQRLLSLLVMFRRERRPGDLVFAVGFFLLAVAAALALSSQAKFLGNNALVAEPGFWPLVGVAMMVVFAGLHLLGAYNAPRLPGCLREVVLWSRSVEYVAWFVLYVTSVPVIGCLPSTLAFALLLCLRLGYRRWPTFVGAASFAVAVVLIFKAGLGVRLPAGAVYQYLPDSIRTFVMVNF